METLEQIGKKYGTDKVTHGFCGWYEEVLGHLRDKPIRFMEIGIFKGASILMWREFFPLAEIHAADIVLDLSREALQGAPNLHVHALDCDFSTELQRFVDRGLTFDVIVDDGGHTMRQQQLAMKVMWKALSPGGIFIMEDLHTSYGRFYPEHNLGKQPTTLEMLEALEAGKSFESRYVTAEEFQAIASDVRKAEVRTTSKAPSVTSVVWKK